jgi:hypothetical protein
MQNSFQFIYIRGLNIGLTIWDKSEVLLGTTWELEVGSLWETHREHDGNKGRKQKIPPSLLPQKEKNWTPHESIQSFSLAAWNFYVQNSLSPFLAWIDGMATPPKKKKERPPFSKRICLFTCCVLTSFSLLC